MKEREGRLEPIVLVRRKFLPTISEVMQSGLRFRSVLYDVRTFRKGRILRRNTSLVVDTEYLGKD